MKKVLKLVTLLVVTFCFASSVDAASNPYGKYQSLYGINTIRCTWYAWQQAYEHTGVALPGWGNAQTWYNSAINDGYKVGSEAKPNSIVVYSSADGYGHVGFVVSVEGNVMTVNEAGIVTEENEGVVNGSQKYTTAGNLIGFIYLDEAREPIQEEEPTEVSEEELSSDAHLSHLEVEGFSLPFDAFVFDYTLEVEYEVSVVHISAQTKDDAATLSGTGDKALRVGENQFTITVRAEDESVQEYQIMIIRSEEETDESTIIQVSNDTEQTQKNFPFLFLGIGIILLVLLVFLIVLGKRRKSKK